MALFLRVYQVFLPDGKKTGGHSSPEVTIATTQSFTLHRNPDFFRNHQGTPFQILFALCKIIPETWETLTQERKEAFIAIW
jgi:hypothetical protein